jgi:hypothetical protein
VRRHEIPTHLGVEDRAFYGLSVRQVTYLMAGSAGGYGLWQGNPDWPAELRLGLAALCLLLAAAFALLRPGRRGLEEWAFAALHYLATPRRARWRVEEPLLADWRTPRVAWAELAPRPSWAERAP